MIFATGNKMENGETRGNFSYCFPYNLEFKNFDLQTLITSHFSTEITFMY
jgi:hypothetical protein